MLVWESIVGFAGPLGLLCVMIVAMGHFASMDANPKRAEILTGLVFGAVAVLQMHMPIEPAPGFIIDLRVVPLVLAGAFLGWRGLAACLACALAARAQIGGVAMAAGLFSILLAGYAGASWRAFIANRPASGRGAYVLLGVAACVSFLGIALLPRDLAAWFVRYALAPFSVAYLILVPAFAAMLQREQARAARTKTLARATQICTESGLLRPASFVRDAAALTAGSQTEAVTGLLIITPSLPPWMRLLGAQGADARLHRKIALALQDLLHFAEAAGLSHNHRVLVPMAATDPQNLTTLKSALARKIRALDAPLGGGFDSCVAVTMRVSPVRTVHEMLRAIQCADLPERHARCAPQTDADRTGPARLPRDSDVLFRKLEDQLLVQQVIRDTQQRAPTPTTDPAPS